MKMTKDEQIKALIERLNECHAVMEQTAETIAEWFPNEDERGDIYLDLISELAPTEELLIKMEKL
jgi:hypothetical protein